MQEGVIWQLQELSEQAVRVFFLGERGEKKSEEKEGILVVFLRDSWERRATGGVFDREVELGESKLHGEFYKRKLAS